MAEQLKFSLVELPEAMVWHPQEGRQNHRAQNLAFGKPKKQAESWDFPFFASDQMIHCNLCNSSVFIVISNTVKVFFF